eukprot:2322-Heterococcus_DN1.PRE.2
MTHALCSDVAADQLKTSARLHSCSILQRPSQICLTVTTSSPLPQDYNNCTHFSERAVQRAILRSCQRTIATHQQYYSAADHPQFANTSLSRSDSLFTAVSRQRKHCFYCSSDV